MDSTKSAGFYSEKSTNQQDKGKSLTDTLAEPVASLVDQGREKASEFADQVREGLNSKVAGHKAVLSGTLEAVSYGLHEACHKLREQNSPLESFVHHGHGALDRASDYLRDNELEEIAQDVQSYASKNPTLVVGALFAVGFLAGRFFRSSAPLASQPYGGRSSPRGNDAFMNRPRRSEVQGSWQ